MARNLSPPPPSRARSHPRSRSVAASCSRCRPTWTPSTATPAWPSFRLASGHFLRGMKADPCALEETDDESSAPVALISPPTANWGWFKPRRLWAGDIIGIPNHGQLRIGDTLTEGESPARTPAFRPLRIPRTPLQTARAGDPMKAKAPREGAVPSLPKKVPPRCFKARLRLGLHRRKPSWARCNSRFWPAGSSREYGLPVRFEGIAIHLGPLGHRRPRQEWKPSCRPTRPISPTINDGDVVYLTRLKWDIDRIDARPPGPDGSRRPRR